MEIGMSGKLNGTQALCPLVEPPLISVLTAVLGLRGCVGRILGPPADDVHVTTRYTACGGIMYVTQ